MSAAPGIALKTTEDQDLILIGIDKCSGETEETNSATAVNYEDSLACYAEELAVYAKELAAYEDELIACEEEQLACQRAASHDTIAPYALPRVIPIQIPRPIPRPCPRLIPRPIPGPLGDRSRH